MSDDDPARTQVTRLLQDMSAGRAAASNELFELLYDELRRLAAARVAAMDPGQTMQATALVHEVWMRLGQAGAARWDSRAHFFGAVARAMRQILVDQHRHRNRQKRGGGVEPEGLSTGIAMPTALDKIDVLALDEALDRLEAAHPRPARVVMLAYFAGASMEEAAEMVGVSVRTAERDWLFARTWLRRELS